MKMLSVYAEEDLQRLLFVDAHTVQRTAGYILFKENQICSGLFLIRHGKVRLYIASEGLCVEQIMGAGCILGIPAAVNGRRYSLNAEILQESEIAFLPIERFRTLMRSNPEATIQVLDFMSREVQALRKTIAGLGKPQLIQ